MRHFSLSVTNVSALLPIWKLSFLYIYRDKSEATCKCCKANMLLLDQRLTCRSALSSSPPVAMYREPSLHDVGETVPKAAVPPSKSTSEPAVMNGGKPVSKPDQPAT